MTITTKKFLNRASWIILTALLIPAGAVQASQDAIPGEKMYPVKLVLEDALLVMMKPSKSATSDMEIKFTKRRLLEVEQVSDTAFVVESLNSLNDQVAGTTDSIEEVKDLEKQSELVQEYIQTLTETQTSLQQQKVAVVNRAAPSATAPTAVNVPQAPVNNYATTNQVVNNYYYSPPAQQDNKQDYEVQRKIEETQAEIRAEMQRLRQVAAENEFKQQQQQIEADYLESQKKYQEEVKKIQDKNEETVRQNQEMIEAQARAMEEQRRAEEEERRKAIEESEETRRMSLEEAQRKAMEEYQQQQNQGHGNGQGNNNGRGNDKDHNDD
jgi:hypothetical protein